MKKFLMMANLISARSWHQWPVFLALALVVLLPTVAPAELVPVGEAVPTGSWTQDFLEFTLTDYPFTSMEIAMTSDDQFAAPAFLNFSEPGSEWSSSLSADGKTAVATGPAINYVEFEIHFAGEMNNPLSFTFQALGENPATDNVLDIAYANWSGTAWTIECASPIPGNDLAAPVPLPGAFVLLGAGLVRLAAYGRRRRQENA